MATYTVTTASDADEDGTIAASLAADQADGGGLSLREAIEWADADAQADEIGFDAALLGATVALTQGQLSLSSDIAIDGDLDGDGRPDVTVDAQGASGVFVIGKSLVWLNGLTVTGGKATDGGGINVQPRGLLDFSHGAIRGNEAEHGGGLFNSGVSTLWDVTVADNTAAISGGGLHNEEGDVSLYNVRLSGNGAQWGGGLSNTLGIVEVFDATVSGNSAAKAGGGLSNYYGEMTLTNTTVSGNSAVEEDGGGLYSEGTTALTNVTLSGNGAQTWGGGHLPPVRDVEPHQRHGVGKQREPGRGASAIPAARRR